MAGSVFSLVASHLLAGFAMVHLDASSHHRYYILLLIVFCCFDAVRSPLIQNIPGQIGLEYTLGFAFHATNFLCLARLAAPKKYSAQDRYSWVLNQLFDPRWTVRRMPRFERLPSKHLFIVRRLFDVTWLGTILYAHSQWRLRIDSRDFLDIPDGFLPRLHTLPPREVIIRLYVYVVSTYIPYCTLRLGHCATSVLAVICGDDPARWPPLFGSIKDAYTIRNFYSRFWHQLMRKPFTSISVLCARTVAPFAPKHVMTWLVILFTFALSAIFHILASTDVSMCSIYPQARFYMSTAVAMIFEDVVQRFFRSDLEGLRNTQGKEREKRDKSSTKIPEANVRPKLAWRVLGYCWVFGFDIWAVSKLVYSSHKCILPG